MDLNSDSGDDSVREDFSYQSQKIVETDSMNDATLEEENFIISMREEILNKSMRKSSVNDNKEKKVSQTIDHKARYYQNPTGMMQDFIKNNRDCIQKMVE
jgi:hypothetical protein